MIKSRELLKSDITSKQDVQFHDDKIQEIQTSEDKTKAEFKTKELVDVSIIIPCKNEVNNLKKTVDSIMNSNNLLSFEIIVVDDASTDSSTEFLSNDLNKDIYKDIYKDIILIKTNSVGAAEARNTGAKVAQGKYLFFCDAHVKVPDGWLDKLVNTLKNTNAHLVAPCVTDMSNISAAGYGQTWDDKLKITWLTSNPRDIVEIPIACGCAFGITKETFNNIGGFDHFFQVWGKEDEEICFKAWLYGYKTVINPEVKVQHIFRPRHPYQVTMANVTYNMLCLAYSHFGKRRLSKTIEIAKNEFFFSTVAEDIRRDSGLILKQREKYFKERKYDDDFFFQKFNISF